MNLNKYFFSTLLGILLCVFSYTTLPAAENTGEANRLSDAKKIGRLESPALRECSGMDASTRRGDLLWAVNDGENGPYLYAMGLEGQDRGRVRVAGAKNRDWEALDAFRWKGDSYLLIADVGDNKARYDTVTLYVVREPELNADQFDAAAVVDISWRIDFHYPDGPRDAEAVAVDVRTATVLIVSKRDARPRVYTLPLKPPDTIAPITAAKVGKIDHLPAPGINDLVHAYGAFRSQPTALDMSPDGTRAVLLTYKHAYLFHLVIGDGWGRTLMQNGEVIFLPLPEASEKLRQREAVCFGADGRTLFVTSEGVGAGIYSVEIR